VQRLDWKTYSEDKDATCLEAGSYLCRLEFPDGGILYRVKRFNVYGTGLKRGYFSTNGKKYVITHYAKDYQIELDL